MYHFSPAAAALAGALALMSTAPAFAAGEVLITHAKALAGNVTPGDAPNYPVTLSRPGLYHFGGNLAPPPGRVGILVATRLVTIDFRGFRLAGGGAASIGISSTQPHATIRNGTISNFAQSGIRSTGAGWMIKEMRVIFNRQSGIDCGRACLVEQSVVSNNGGNGINMASGAVVGNTLSENTGFAIRGTGDGVGYGVNSLIFNTGGVFDQVDGEALAMHPNVCREPAGALATC